MQLGYIFHKQMPQRVPQKRPFRLIRCGGNGACGLAALLLLAASLLSAAECRAGSITLAWNASPEPVTGYTVSYGGQSVISYPSGATSANAGKVLQCTISGLTAGKTYFFAVKAYNDYGQSGYSNEVSGIVPAPTTTTTVPTTSSSILTTTTTSSIRTTTTTSIFSDADNDGIADRYDNCPYSYNPQQLDADGDGIGDVCDTTPGCGGCGQPACEKYIYASAQASATRSADSDGDGIDDDSDNCPDVYNPRQLDANTNGVGDCCDPAPGCGGDGAADCDTECSR